MSEGNAKRKQGRDASGDGPAFKRNKAGGNAGKWQTAHRKAKQAERVELGTTLDVGDAGLWVTYARGMKTKAVREFRAVCDEYGESLFGLKPAEQEDGPGEDDEDEPADIEASIQKELEEMKQTKKPATKQTFTPISTGLECLFFMKMEKPVDPYRLVRQLCLDAQNAASPTDRKCKYINRLTPVFDTDRTTEKGIEKVARAVLEPYLQLKGESEEGLVPASSEGQESGAPKHCTYAIRHNIRNNSNLKSDAVIKMVAGLVKPEHPVNLTSPDKVVLIEIFQTFCGISVVDGKEWEGFKRYNLNELYKMAWEKKSAEAETKAKTDAESG